MTTTYETLPGTTRVWIYQSNRELTEKEMQEIRPLLSQFAQQWVSHNQQLRAHADVLYNRFVVLMVDESQAGASGCSIDKSVYFMKQLESSFGISLFDRMTFCYKDGESVRSASKAEFAELYRNGKISDDTLVFDNLVKNKEELDNRWIVPLKASWHKRMI